LKNIIENRKKYKYTKVTCNITEPRKRSMKGNHNNSELKITTFGAVCVNIPAEADLSFRNGSITT